MTGIKGNKIANQFIITDGNITEFQSYGSLIVSIEKNEFVSDTVYLDQKYWNYSNTTSKYRNMFLGETKKETMKKIESGEYVLTDLNKEVQQC